MRILVIGGTLFLGRVLVQAALTRGHNLTLFNRGQTNPDLFPAVERIRGDRDGDLDGLKGRSWDAVIDTCGYIPRIVRKSVEALKENADHYTFISTESVYADFSVPGIDERAPLAKLQDELCEDVNGETYGPLKALCEQVVGQVFNTHSLIVRPGLIVGPHDPSDRFTYWLQRVAWGGEVLAPGRAGRHIQFVDVRDLAEWTIQMVEAGQGGAYNADGPAGMISMAELLETSQRISESRVSFTWVSEQFLIDQQVSEWTSVPLWVPESEPKYAGFFSIDNRKAIGAGLRFKPLVETVRDTLEWASSRPSDHTWRAGLNPVREAELLRLWKLMADRPAGDGDQ